MSEWVSVSDVLDALPDLEPGESSAIDSHNAINHREGTVEKIAGTNRGQSKHPAYARAYSHKPAFTIVAGKGASPIHHREDRRCTVRECARLQTFPDEYKFGHISTRNSRFQLVGNAVPPLLAEKIGEMI